MKNYDVVVIGAGVAGAAAARELARYKLDIAVLEKNIEAACEVTKGTHAIIHVGLSTSPLTPVKNRCELQGAAMMEQYCADLDVKYKRCGKLAVAFDEDGEEKLKAMMLAAKRNGLTDIEFIDKAKVLKMEPNISPDVRCAFYTKNTAIISPWGLVYGLLENAQMNGADVITDCCVESLAWDEKGGYFAVQTTQGPMRARYVVNAAGAHAGKVAAMADDHSFEIGLVRQEKVIVDKHHQDDIRHVVRAIKPDGSLGDFLAPTVYGDLMGGVYLSPQEEYGNDFTTPQGIEEHVISRMRRLVLCVPPSSVIRPFSGSIAQTKGAGEYVIGPSRANPHFINMVLGGSGLSASPAAAQYLVLELFPAMEKNLVIREDFIPTRKDMPHVSEMEPGELAELVERDPRYGHVVCRCETVTEGEIVEAIRRGARSIDGVKFRTRAGMGRCQGGFCGPRVLAILSRELRLEPQQVTKKGGASRMVWEFRRSNSREAG